MEHQESNPWAVESIMAFNYFVCPECNFQAKTPPSFETHAMENHPRARKLFDPQESLKADADTVVEELLKSMQQNEVKTEEPENYYFDINIGEEYDNEESETQSEQKETDDKNFYLGLISDSVFANALAI